MKNFYLLGAVVGFVVPWAFFGSFFAAEGLNISLFISSLFDNGASGGFSADVLISAVNFLVWSYTDSQKNHVERWVGGFTCHVCGRLITRLARLFVFARRCQAEIAATCVKCGCGILLNTDGLNHHQRQHSRLSQMTHGHSLGTKQPEPLRQVYQSAPRDATRPNH